MSILLVNGQTSTGKTTLARELAKELGCARVAKDEYKEKRMDQLGRIPSLREWVRIEHEAWRLLQATVQEHIASGEPLIVEADFNRLHAKKLAPFLRGKRVSEVYCYARPGVVLWRYMRRSKSATRHPGHRDHLWYATLAVECGLGYLGLRWVRPIESGARLLNVDTTDFAKVDHAAICAFAAEALGGQRK